MKCPKCDHQNREGEKFCEDCGVNMEKAAAKAAEQQVQEAPQVEETKLEIESVSEPFELKPLNDTEEGTLELTDDELLPEDFLLDLDEALAPEIKVAGLKLGDATYELMQGKTLFVARAGTNQCVRDDNDKTEPDIPVDDATASATPVTISDTGKKTADGKRNILRVKDHVTSNGFRVVRMCKPGEEVEVAVGDMLVIGKTGIIQIL